MKKSAYLLLCVGLIIFTLSSCKDKKKAEEVVVPTEVVEPVVEEVPVVTEEKALGNDGMFHVITAAYRQDNTEYAEKLVNKLIEKGFDAKIVDAEGFLRVSVGGFETENEAYNQLPILMDKIQRFDLWVYKAPN